MLSGEDRSQALSLAQVVHVRLECGDVSVCVQTIEPVVPHVRLAGRNVEILVVSHVGGDQVFVGDDTPRIERMPTRVRSVVSTPFGA